MFEAALRVLENEPFEAFTTNRIAAVAGVSIGTLYQYFPDKDALLVALAEREIEATFERLGSLRQYGIGSSPDSLLDPMEARVRQAVQVMAQALGGRLRARKQMLIALVRSGQAQMLDEQILSHGMKFMAAASDGDEHAPPALNDLDFVQGFVLARAVSGVLRAALLHDENLLTDPRFEDALCSLITGYLR